MLMLLWPICCCTKDALVNDPDFLGARYVEGVAVWSAGLAGQEDVQYLGLEAQGWLELPDGRIVHPTVILAGPRRRRLPAVTPVVFP